jgi:hypothetical protein
MVETGDSQSESDPGFTPEERDVHGMPGVLVAVAIDLPLSSENTPSVKSAPEPTSATGSVAVSFQVLGLADFG